MKKSIYYIIPVLAFILFANTFGQKPVIELTFTAVNNSQNVPLDSIYIENLTQGGDTTLYGADTILSLEYNVGIFDNYSFNENSLSVSQNYPNPFTDQTKINIYLPEKEYIKITVRDILGRELAQYENRFNRGNHSFIFYSGNEKYYLFTVTGKQTSKTIKMLIANGNTTNVRKCKIVYNDYEENVIGFKSQKAVNDFIFYLGDELLLVGYSDLGESVLIDSPSATQIYSFQFATNIPCPGTPTVTYEGQVYNTIQIFSQCWLKENLNVGTMINGSQNQSNNSTIEKYCYDNDPANCNTYGGQYQWDEMMQYQTTQGVQGICPPDWHLPTDEEWKQLEGAVDSQYGYPDPGWDGAGGWRGFDAGLNLKSTNGWYSGGNGADLYGFNALPGGYRYFGGDFMELGLYGPFWASTEFDSYAAWYRSLSSSSDKVYRNEYPNACGISVRCLKDDTITSIPSVTTGIVLNITINSADIEGEITDLGGSDVTQHGHCWSTNPNPTINDYKTELGAAAGIGSFTSNLTGLNSLTTYFARAYAINSSGIAYGNEIEILTATSFPSVTTGIVLNITINSADIEGEITDLGGSDVTQHGHCWSTNPNPTINDYKTELGAAAGIGSFTSNLTGLNSLTTYFARAYAINSSGIAYGNEIEILTAGSVPCPGIPTVTYEGQVYNTVLIVNQCWLKENLNVGTMIPGTQEMEDNGVIEKYCYDNNPSNCDTCGGLYQWDEMMQYVTTQGVQGICPPDWHLPTDEEWKQLEGKVDNQYGYPDPEWDGLGFRGFDAGLNLKSTNGWYSGGNGADLYGFTVLPGGYRYFDGNIYELGYSGTFWSSTDVGSYYAWPRGLFYNHGGVYRTDEGKGFGFSVRCLKN